MPRLRIPWHQPPLPLGFLDLRDEFRRRRLELFFDRSADRYEVRRGVRVLTTCTTLAQARGWLNSSRR